MKLFLTSSGLTNKSLDDALEALLERPIERAKLAFIHTAANVEPGESWLINDLNNFLKAGLEVDIVDISALPRKVWLYPTP